MTGAEAVAAVKRLKALHEAVVAERATLRPVLEAITLTDARPGMAVRYLSESADYLDSAATAMTGLLGRLLADEALASVRSDPSDDSVEPNANPAVALARANTPVHCVACGISHVPPVAIAVNDTCPQRDSTIAAQDRARGVDQ